MKKINLELPKWAFLHSESHEGNPLGTRTVIEHVPTGSIFEVFDRDFDTFGLNPDVLQFNFRNEGLRMERLTIALHRGYLLDPVRDREELLALMKECAVWYCDYCDWFDRKEWDK